MPTSVELTNLGPHHCVIVSHLLTSPVRDGETLRLSDDGSILAPGKSIELFAAELLRGALESDGRGVGWRRVLGIGRSAARVAATVALPSARLSVVTALSDLASLGVNHSELPDDRRAYYTQEDWDLRASTFSVDGAEILIAEEML